MPNPENIANQGFHTNPERINIDGRPKGAKSLTTKLRQAIEARKNQSDSQTYGDDVIAELLALALNADDAVKLRAIEQILDRLEGKATQNVNTTQINDVITIRFGDNTPPTSGTANDTEQSQAV